MFEKVLIPIEFGTQAAWACRMGRKLTAPGGRVRLLHVVTNETTLFFADVLHVDRLTAGVEKGLAALRADHEAASELGADTQIREGTIWKEVVAEAAEWGAGAIVMGSHGRRGLQRMLLGSVAERVVRDAGVPVCVVKEEVGEGRLERIGLATDLEDSSGTAAACFARLLKGSGARGDAIHVFHAEHWLSMASGPAPFVESAYAGGGSGGVPDTEIQNRLRARRAERQDALDTMVKGWRDDGLDVEARLLEGEPWTEMSAFAEREKLDLILLGSHKYGAVDRFVLGSIAEKTLRAAHCPVLVVPRQA